MAFGARFFGSYEHSLDAKGRVFLPAKLRSPFAAGAYLTPHLEGCLALWTGEEFEQEIALRLTQADSSAEARNETREWSAAVFETTLDSQGRIVVPARLRDYSGLQQDVLIIGSINRLELWSPEHWAAKAAAPNALRAGSSSR